jgi:MFS family permease
MGLMYLPLVVAFAGFGVSWGAWAVLLPELSRDLAPSPGALGLALSMGVVGSIPAMVAGGRLVDRFGPRQLGLLAGLVYGAGVAGIAASGSFMLLVAVLFVAFASSGIYDVAINAAAIDFEQRSRRRVLPMLHAAFSAGGALGAAGGGLALALGAPYRWLYVAVGAVVLCAVGIWAQRPAPPHRRIVPEPGERTLFRSPALLALGGATAMAFFAEGTMESWSAIYLRASLGLSVILGSSGPAMFHAAMFVGRIGSAGTVARFGRHATMAAAGAVMLAGMTLALATSNGALVLIGFAVVGLSLSAVAPVAISLAGEEAAGRAGQASAVITTIGYVGFLVGPAVIGGIAEVSSLRLALAAVGLAGIAILAIALRIRQRPQPRRSSIADPEFSDDSQEAASP